MADPAANPPKPPPPPRPSGPALSIPRRRAATRTPFADSAPSGRESMRNLAETPRPSYERKAAPGPEQVAELERSLRRAEAALVERDRVAAETKNRLAE